MALLAGSVLALAALAYVLYPLLAGRKPLDLENLEPAESERDGGKGREQTHQR